jgi:hypothetical protein
MQKSTTIAITKEVHNLLLSFIHMLEDKDKKRLSYSDAIKYLLDKVKR